VGALLLVVLGIVLVLEIQRMTDEEPIQDRDPGDENQPVDACTCPRHVTHTAIRDSSGTIYCVPCQLAYGEGMFLPENRRVA
jgi:hypothetical protein